MLSLIGEYDVTLDVKGRFALPTAFRKKLAAAGEELSGGDNQFVISRGFEECLSLYTMKRWETIFNHVSRLNDFQPKVRDFKRLFLNGATEVELDSAGRLLIPKSLQEHAGLEKDIVFSAQGDKAEIWDKTTYKNYLRSRAASYSDLAAEVAGTDFLNAFAGV